MQFNKPHKTLDEQLALLVERGLIVENVDRAKHYLGHLNYYRLSAYWFPLKETKNSNKFIPGTTFGDIINLYVFDREFRLLLLDAIERIEVSIRSKWAYLFCKKYGSHAHLNSSLFKNFNAHENSIQVLENEVSKSKETFIIHLSSKYEERLPPLWSLVEIMSFGQLSYRFGMLKYRNDKNAVARIYDMDEKNFVSILHHLTVLRNKCAHHNRLWNCEFTIFPRNSIISSYGNNVEPQELFVLYGTFQKGIGIV